VCTNSDTHEPQVEHLLVKGHAEKIKDTNFTANDNHFSFHKILGNKISSAGTKEDGISVGGYSVPRAWGTSVEFVTSACQVLSRKF
jgi:hypothetical protein